MTEIPNTDKAMKVDIDNSEITVDARVLGELLYVPAAEVPGLLRLGAITSICERGVGADAGRYRLTFFHSNSRVRLSVDAQGRIVQRAVIDFGDRELPPVLRRAGS